MKTKKYPRYFVFLYKGDWDMHYRMVKEKGGKVYNRPFDAKLYYNVSKYSEKTLERLKHMREVTVEELALMSFD